METNHWEEQHDQDQAHMSGMPGPVDYSASNYNYPVQSDPGVYSSYVSNEPVPMTHPHTLPRAMSSSGEGVLIPEPPVNGEIEGKVQSSVTQEQIEATLTPFWAEMVHESGNIHPGETDFKTHSDLPLARIKRIMKADEDVRMVSAEAPVMFARACRLFIMELTKRAWLEAEDCKRKTLQKEDIHAAILKADVFDFLVDVVDGTIEEEHRQLKLEQQRKANADQAEQLLPPQQDNQEVQEGHFDS